MKKLNLIIWIVAALMILASLIFRSLTITWSVAAGVAIVLGSFYLLCFSITRLNSSKRAAKIFGGLLIPLKTLLIGIALWLVITKLPVNTVAFLVGLSTIALAIFVYAIISWSRKTT